MKTININAADEANPIPLEPEDKQPCWYANFSDHEDRTQSTWTVGVKRLSESKREYSFKPCMVGDVTDDTFWRHTTSSDFAIGLIDLFRDGGEHAVVKWIKSKGI